eukprot:3464613-Amphidinium_carterae.1
MSKQTLETPEGQKGLYNVTSRVHCQGQVCVTGSHLATLEVRIALGSRAAITDIMFSRGFKGIRDLSDVLSSGATCTNTHL